MAIPQSTRPSYADLLIEACGMLKLLDRHANLDSVTDFLQRVDTALAGGQQ